MFVLDQSDSYLWPVKIELPDNGRKKVFTFDAEFKRLPQAEVEELRQRHLNNLSRLKRALSAADGYGANGDEELSGISEMGDETREICDLVLCGWAKVSDAKGEEVEFSEATKRQMYRVQGAPAAILDAWFDSLGEPSEKAAAKAGGFRAKN